MKRDKLTTKIMAVILVGTGLIITWGMFEGVNNQFPASAEEENESPPKPEGGDEYADKVYETMAVSRKIDLTTMRKLTKEDILLVDAKTPEDKNVFTRDRVHDVLKALNIPFTKVDHKELETRDLKTAAALVVNCTEVTLNQKSADNVKRFLEGGGYMFTTDWAFDFVLQKVAPGYLKPASVTQMEDHTVLLQPFEKNKNHIFLRGVFPDGRQVSWMFRKGARTFHIVKPEAVTVLVVGPDSLKKEAGSNILAVTWCLDKSARGYNPKFDGYKEGSVDYLKQRPKGGVILHVANHYSQRVDGNADADANCSMYQLVVNFLIDARLSKLCREQTKPPDKPKK